MTKKTFALVLAALLALFTVFGVSSEAKVMEFEHISIDVPDGWRVEEDKESYTVAFYAPGDAAALTISSYENEGVPLKDVTKMYMDKLNGENLMEAGDAYMFDFKSAAGSVCTSAVMGDEKLILFLTFIGRHDDFEKMIGSMERVKK